jgi:hypothetical protein
VYGSEVEEFRGICSFEIILIIVRMYVYVWAKEIPNDIARKMSHFENKKERT